MPKIYERYFELIEESDEEFSREACDQLDFDSDDNEEEGMIDE